MSKPPQTDPSEDIVTSSVSKSARKREATRLQQLGLRISQLTSDQRAALQLPEKLDHAIDEYLRFPSREAKRRQLQFVGKVMRNIDVEALEAQLASLEGESAEARYQFHHTEMWRDRLIADASNLPAYIDAHPHVDRQALRHALKRVHTAKTEALTKRYSRELFRLLRDADNPID